MGRKPNAMILRHFHRNEKLSDNSNRYAHTCKHCGTRFPKGRADALVNHTLKKCPSMTIDARRRAVLEHSGLPDDGTYHVQDELQNDGSEPNGMHDGGNNWTGLQLLAEVSRREFKPNANNSQLNAARPLRVQEHYSLDNPPVSYVQRTSREKKCFGNHSSLQPGPYAISRSSSPNFSMAARATSVAQAAAAGFAPNMVDPENLDPEILRDDSSMIPNTAMGPADQLFAQQMQNADVEMADHHVNSDEHSSPWPMGNDHADDNDNDMYQEAPRTIQPSIERPSPVGYPQQESNFRPLAILPAGASMTTQFSAEPGDGQRHANRKSRNNFTDLRRLEVQGVRKKGACIRCRILKKPCDAGDPCKACASVDCARIWKNECSRERLAKELDMFSASLHMILMRIKLEAQQPTADWTSVNIQIEASHHPDVGIFALLKVANEGQVKVDSNVDPSLNDVAGGGIVHVLVQTPNTLDDRIEKYASQMTEIFIQREPSDFMKTTLTIATETLQAKNDILLQQALDLWVMVHILVDHEVRWVFTRRTDSKGPAGSVPGVSERSWRLINAQLSSAVEKKAAALAKEVLNGIEGRLLKPEGKRSFVLFLIGLLVCNCLEKTTWFFNSYQQVPLLEDWPLGKEPKVYAEQGEKVTNMISMLLRMKYIPPTVGTDNNGYIQSTYSENATQFFERERLLHARDNAEFNPLDSRCFELRFCSRLLLNEGPAKTPRQYPNPLTKPSPSNQASPSNQTSSPSQPNRAPPEIPWAP
ncbi:hypothetical protein BJ875DRAFT_366873 [Amylocarpus encephaloides]|uniref:Zn(2)-C6 fungal-type domain-containing protein n=1 Tax=Amylocarpus encephaloides TaxID=45428 RepID=A0A9P7YT03_9HELO|nr:hypothetical protein BJ875DRAFT_366873 [Amylocarpus encephaloides]